MFKDRYINPLTDFGFKKLFGEEPNKEFLISFLNSVLPDYHQIKDLNYSKNERLRNTPLDRRAIFDLHCVAEDGTKFIVEVQKAKQNYFKDRSIYYATFPIQEQAEQGDWNFKLTPIYTVAILDFVFNETKAKERVKTTAYLKDQENEILYDKLCFIYLEMPKFNKTLEELKTNQDKWLYVLKHLSNLNDRPEALQKRIFESFFRQAEISSFSPTELQAYHQSLKYYRDMHNVINTHYEDGLKKGKKEGIEEGLEKGKIEMVLNFLRNNVSVEVAAEASGLSIEEIEKLKQKLKSS